jgi:hypothetical protein
MGLTLLAVVFPGFVAGMTRVVGRYLSISPRKSLVHWLFIGQQPIDM